jgi:hypothetical protein
MERLGQLEKRSQDLKCRGELVVSSVSVSGKEVKQ